MTDPRFTDDPRLRVHPEDKIEIDPVLRPDENFGSMWGWAGGVSLLLLIGFLIFAGWTNNNSNTASSGSSTSTTTSRITTPPSTTGSGLSSPQPITPAPSAPAPSKSGTQ
jgi:hypothetical protein